jgi:tRNA uridine 5-carbamoylmethylation protein Kti12
MGALIVNMFGGPGRGKSTTAYRLIGLLKSKNHKAELVVESAKNAAWTNAKHKLEDQVYLVATHNHDLRVLENQVDIIVTDGSLLNCLAYADPETQKMEIELSKELYSRYKNIGFIVPRKEIYMQYGRSQNRDEAEVLDKKIFDSIAYLPEDERIDLQHMSSDSEEFIDTIYKHICERLESN